MIRQTEKKRIRYGLKDQPKTQKRMIQKHTRKKNLVSTTHQDPESQKPVSSKSPRPCCPHCGGWIVVEQLMDFYSPQHLQKCLNCGRILVNPLLPMTIAKAQNTKTFELPPDTIKLRDSFFVPFSQYEDKIGNSL